MPADAPAFDPGFAFEAPAGPRLEPGRRYDVLVLGAGPAGLSAAIYLVRKGRAVGVLGGTLGGQVAWTAGIANYLGFRLIEGTALVNAFREQVSEAGPDLGLGLEVTDAARREGGFVVTAGGGEYRARALVIATGKRPRTLGVPGEQRLLGRGVAFCATCDAPLYRGKAVAVVGGGNSGLEAALELAQSSPGVVLVEAAGRLSGDAVLAEAVRRLPNVEVLPATRVVEIAGEDRVTEIVVRPGGGGGTRRIPVEGVFVEIGLDPNSEPFRKLVPLSPAGEVVVDCAARTPVAGVFAAGDVTTVPWKQIVVAAGDGAKAALSAHDWLARGGGADQGEG